MAKLRPKNWEGFQHYSNRTPTWIKLHKRLLDDFEFHRLPILSRALAPMLWLLASEDADGVFDGDPARLGFRLRMPTADVEEALKHLLEKGFFEVVDESAIKPLAQELDSAIPEEEREEEERKNKNKRKKEILGSGYTPEFEAAWSAYPARPGASKADAFKAWMARVRAGADPAKILAGVVSYAAYVRAMGTEPQFIKQPTTFFGPGMHFETEWKVPPSRGRGGGHNLAGQDYSSDASGGGVIGG